MRLIRNTKRRSEGESAASSVRSTDSYGVFGSACSGCSDLSECDYEEKQRQDRLKYNAMSRSSSYRSVVEGEATPLLTAAPLGIQYSAITTSSSDSLGPGELTASEIIATYKRTMEKSTKNETRKQSSLVTIFSVWNTIMGSSLLTMAWGVERAGLPAALVLLVGMAALCLYTAYLLIRVNANHGSATCEVPALCGALLGRGAAVVAHAFSLVVLMGANIVYWILITNFLYYTVYYFMDLHQSNGTEYNTTLLCPKHDAVIGPLPISSPPSPYWDVHLTVPMYVAVIIYPLLNFKNVSFFTKFNSLGTLSVVYLLIFVMVKGWTWGINLQSLADVGLRAGGTGGAGGEGVAGGADAAVLSGMLALSFYIHNIIITIMGNNAKQENNGRDLTIAFLLVTITYTLVGTVFYICFPLDKSCIEDNILNNFEMHDVMTAVARALLLFQVITVFPLVAYMLRREATLLLPLADGRALALALNAALVGLCVLVACLAPDIGNIIRYTGAVSGLVHVFALPSLLQLRSLQLRGKLTIWKAALYICIIIFGIVNLLLQFLI